MRVIIIHTLEHAVTALATAEELHVPVTLQTAPDAIFYAGPLYLKSLFDEAQHKYPKVKATCILDCGDAGAEAVAAMEAGHKFLRSSAHPEIRAKLASIAAQCGAELVDGEYEALDLLTVRDTKGECKRWLSEKAV